MLKIKLQKRDQESIMADNKILSDFVATAYNDGDVETAIKKFPELHGYDKKLLADFVATAYKDGDVNVALKKFPEFNVGYGVARPEVKQWGNERVPSQKVEGRSENSGQPLTDEEARKAIYGNVPGTTKIGDVSFLPTGGGYQNTKGKASVQKPNTDVQVSVPVQSIYGNAPQLQMPTITSEDIEKQDEEILLPPEDLERIAKMRTPGKFDREREMAIKNYEADKEEQRLKEYYKSPEGRNEYNAHINYLNKVS